MRKIIALFTVIIGMLFPTSISAGVPSRETLISSCNPCVVNETIVLMGNNYEPGKAYALYASGASTGLFFADSDGRIRVEWPYTNATGVWEFGVWQMFGHKHEIAHITVTVE